MNNRNTGGENKDVLTESLSTALNEMSLSLQERCVCPDSLAMCAQDLGERDGDGGSVRETEERPA